MTNAPAIVEDSSKKPRRGRPRGYVRSVADSIGHPVAGTCQRSRSNFAYVCFFMGELTKASEAEQLRAIGTTIEEIKTGARNTPKGWQTLGEAAGRALMDGMPEVVAFIGTARERGLTFSQIARKLNAARLGMREGNAHGLCLTITAAMDRYQERFPLTRHDARLRALETLLQLVRDNPPENQT